MVGPQTTRNGVVAIDPHTTRSDVAWDHSFARTNDDMSRFGMMPSCGVRRSTRGIKRHNAKTERIAFSPINGPRSDVVRGHVESAWTLVGRSSQIRYPAVSPGWKEVGRGPIN